MKSSTWCTERQPSLPGLLPERRRVHSLTYERALYTGALVPSQPQLSRVSVELIRDRNSNKEADVKDDP